MAYFFIFLRNANCLSVLKGNTFVSRMLPWTQTQAKGFSYVLFLFMLLMLFQVPPTDNFRDFTNLFAFFQEHTWAGWKRYLFRCLPANSIKSFVFPINFTFTVALMCLIKSFASLCPDFLNYIQHVIILWDHFVQIFMFTSWLFLNCFTRDFVSYMLKQWMQGNWSEELIVLVAKWPV